MVEFVVVVWIVEKGGSKVSLCVHVGIQVGGLFASGLKQLCFEPYVDMLIDLKGEWASPQPISIPQPIPCSPFQQKRQKKSEEKLPGKTCE